MSRDSCWYWVKKLCMKIDWVIFSIVAFAVIILGLLSWLGYKYYAERDACFRAGGIYADIANTTVCLDRQKIYILKATKTSILSI